MRLALLAALPFLAVAAMSPAQELEKKYPGQIVDAAPAEAWVEIPAEDILIVTLEGDREIIFQLAPAFAPQHDANIKTLAASDYWDGASVYRVQDNYVAQFGLRDIERDTPEALIAAPDAEYVFDASGLDMVPLGSPDPYSMLAGFSAGWPVAVYEDGSASLTHCYGALGVGRGLSPDTGNGTELYAIIGHAPRHLDRNIAIVGRAIEGIAHLAALERGSEGLGMYGEAQMPTPISDYVIAATLPEADRPTFEYLDEGSASFADYLDRRANRYDDFYGKPAGGVALCNVQVPVRRKTGG